MSVLDNWFFQTAHEKIFCFKNWLFEDKSKKFFVMEIVLVILRNFFHLENLFFSYRLKKFFRKSIRNVFFELEKLVLKI